jgi:hypothetical protein
VFVSIAAAANAGVPGDKAGLAAGLPNASQQVGSALGLAILSVLAITRTNELIAANASPVIGLDAGYHRALLVGSILMAAAALIALRIGNTRAAAPLVLADTGPAREPAGMRSRVHHGPAGRSPQPTESVPDRPRGDDTGSPGLPRLQQETAGRII